LVEGGLATNEYINTKDATLFIVYFDCVPVELLTIPGGVTGFFSDIFPTDRTMALGSTQPLVKMSTRDISWR